MALRIHSLESFGTYEGPGIRYIIFLQGCFFRCAYCHNPDSIPLDRGNMMEIDQLLHNIRQEKDYFGKKGGVTVSGGEPLVQAKELIPLFDALHAEGIHTALDTNGYLHNDDVKKLLDLTDLVLLDVKHINTTRHKKLTGKDNKPVLKMVQYLSEINKSVRLRYVLVPGWTDQEEYLHEWAKTLSIYKNIERIEILPYHTLGVYKWKELGWPYALEGVTPPTNKILNHTKEIFKQYFTQTISIR